MPQILPGKLQRGEQSVSCGQTRGQHRKWNWRDSPTRCARGHVNCLFLFPAEQIQALSGKLGWILVENTNNLHSGWSRRINKPVNCLGVRRVESCSVMLTGSLHSRQHEHLIMHAGSCMHAGCGGIPRNALHANAVLRCVVQACNWVTQTFQNECHQPLSEGADLPSDVHNRDVMSRQMRLTQFKGQPWLTFYCSPCYVSPVSRLMNFKLHKAKVHFQTCY
jgi:hypothetical protein